MYTASQGAHQGILVNPQYRKIINVADYEVAPLVPNSIGIEVAAVTLDTEQDIITKVLIDPLKLVLPLLSPPLLSPLSAYTFIKVI